MREKILALEKVAQELEPNAEQRKGWIEQVVNYTDQFLENIETRKAFVVADNQASEFLRYGIGEEGRDMASLIRLLDKHVNTPGLNPASGGHLAYIPGGGIFPTALGDYIVDIFNTYAGIFFTGPGAVRMENMLLRWMCDLIGFPKTALGNLTSGGSIANLTAIVTARDCKRITPKRIEVSVIYLTEQAHHSVQKAIRIAGLNEAILRYIPVDDRFRMDTVALEKNIAKDKAAGLNPFLVIASAGTTDTGAIDAMDKISELAVANDMWFHVDAAYGGFFLLAEEVKASFRGIERADSVTIDPHKGLFLSYGLGAVLIKDVAALQQSHYYKANYMQDAVGDVTEPSPADLSPELTKHFRGMRMWLPLQLLGVKRFSAALSEKIWLCRYFYEAIQKLGFEVGPYPELSVTIYRYVPARGDANEFNKALVKAVQEEGSVFLSSTTIGGVYWLRLAVLCFRSHLRTIDTCLRVLEKSVERLNQTLVS
ncbi:MAG: aspartate aminotransferase family protein [Saprospiraceae bacterium]